MSARLPGGIGRPLRRTRCSSGRRKPSINKEAVMEETIGYETLLSTEEWRIHGEAGDQDAE